MQAKIAGLGRRLGALLYDWFLMLAIWILTCFVWFPIQGEAVTGPALTMVLGLEMAVFYAFCWIRHGETLGMRAWRIRLVNAEGRSPTIKNVLIRLLTAPPSLLCFGIGYLWFYVSKSEQALPDYLSQTFVVYLENNR